MRRTCLLLLAIGVAGCLATPIPIPLNDAGADSFHPTGMSDRTKGGEWGMPPPSLREGGVRLDAGQSGLMDGDGRRDGLGDAVSDGRRDGAADDAKRDSLGEGGAPLLDGARDLKKKDGP